MESANSVQRISSYFTQVFVRLSRTPHFKPAFSSPDALLRLPLSGNRDPGKNRKAHDDQSPADVRPSHENRGHELCRSMSNIPVRQFLLL